MQVLVNGLVSGASIALLALAFAVVYLPTRVFHIALAGIAVKILSMVKLGNNSKKIEVWMWKSNLDSNPQT